MSPPLLPQPQCTVTAPLAMFVKTERGSRSDDHYPRLAVAPGHQLHRDGLAVTVPLEPSGQCQPEAVVPGSGRARPLAKAITLHTGLAG